MNDKQFGKGPQQLLNYPHDPPSFPSPSCPRCSSSKTKFCYYNNYSVSQPRYFCKDCRRYWTHGGTIRNIPNNVTNRKRGRATSTSSSSQSSKSASLQGLVVPPALSITRCMGSCEAPKSASSSTSRLLLSQHSGILYPTLAPKAWSTGFPDKPVGGGVDSSIGGGTFRLPINETNQSIIGGGISNQTTFMFSPDGELGVMNNTFGAINAPFVGGAPPQPFSPNSLLHHFSLIGGSYELGMPFLQPSQHQLIPSPSQTAWTTQNMTHSSINTNANNMIPKARNTTTTNNVISINEWPDFVDMEIEGDPLQSYKSLSP